MLAMQPVATPIDLDKKELLQAALYSVSLLDDRLTMIFNNLDNGESYTLSNSNVREHDRIYNCIYLMKLEARETVASALFVIFFSADKISMDRADIGIILIKKALMSLSLNYREWVIMRVRYILVDFDDTKTLNSGSSPQSPDTIRISGNLTRHGIAEMVVHEASHLHYNITVQNDAVTQKDAPEVYSVFMRCNRPLERIVFAYHAACNIAYMQGQPPQYDHQVKALQDTAALKQTIAENQRFLTIYGQKLIEALS
ncbi:hypothetical protein [Psychrobacter sp. M13]|uniref:hypothetical protein n=1 Tax=Psychrobacter sp. M13 TaxID=3067275 RepID=UPI00273AC0D5|nr:hypothetical protein [Psychrobacter sp. M13]WLP94631.1 hypothetical protein Q9G97_00460 [Psychrobacter sp. M13]